MSAVAPIVHSDRVHAHVALVELDAEMTEFLRTCLFQMGIKSFALNERIDLAKRQFEGFVVDLRRDDTETLLKALRSSPRNQRAVIFGLYSEPSQLRQYSKYGVNAVIAWPAKRTDAVKILRSAQTLLVDELRRYARIPLAVDVEISVRGQRHRGISREVSGGGMSISFSNMPKLAKSDYAELSFVIPPGTNIAIKGVVCWIHETDNLVGIQFMPDGDKVKPVRTWIDNYLGIG